MIKTICSICEKKISEIKKEESQLGVAVYYQIKVQTVNIDSLDTLFSHEFILCPGCYGKVELI